MHQLGDVEELLAPEDHLPVRVEADVAHQRHHRVEDLRDAAAERGRADVEHPLAGQRLRELADLLDQAAPDEVGVVGQRALAKSDFLKHADGNIPAAPPATLNRRREPLDAAVELADDRFVQLRVRRRDARDLELGAGAEQRALGERRAVGVGDDRPGLLEDQRRRRQVVGGVVEHRAVAHALELLAHSGNLGHDPRARLDVGVELAGDDPGHVVGGRAEVEGRRRRPRRRRSAPRAPRRSPAPGRPRRP